ncbi:MAG: glycosyltransferase family 4 protein [Nitrospirae bacterium]|nr:glycosyltransferase family 4 protein [Nitrospirota bacterium]
MKILAFQPYAQREGHFGYYTTYVCKGLAAMGLSITLVTTRLETDKYLASDPKFRIIETGRSALSGFQKRGAALEGLVRGLSLIWDNVRVLLRMLRTLRKEPYDAVQFFDYEPITTYLLLGIGLTFFRGRFPPLFFIVQAADPSLQGHANLLYQLYGKLSRPALKRLLSHYAKAILADGLWQPGELEALMGLTIGAPPLVSVPHGAILEDKPRPRDTARRALGLKYDGTLLLFFGMLRKDKGVDLLIEAMGKVRGEFKLLLAGMPFDLSEEAVREMIREQGCEDEILTDLRYVPQEKIADYFSAADAVVFPYRSHYKGTVGPLNTVLAFGKPVIGSRVRDLAVYFQETPIGILTEPDSVASLAAAIEQFLLLTPAQRETLAENGRRLAENYSWAGLAKRFSEVYKTFSETECPRP